MSDLGNNQAKNKYLHETISSRIEHFHKEITIHKIQVKNLERDLLQRVEEA